jgi:hypothetical protein
MRLSNVPINQSTNQPILGTLILDDIPDAVSLVACEAPKMKKFVPAFK